MPWPKLPLVMVLIDNTMMSALKKKLIVVCHTTVQRMRRSEHDHVGDREVRAVREREVHEVRELRLRGARELERRSIRSPIEPRVVDARESPLEERPREQHRPDRDEVDGGGPFGVEDELERAAEATMLDRNVPTV